MAEPLGGVAAHLVVAVGDEDHVRRGRDVHGLQTVAEELLDLGAGHRGVPEGEDVGAARVLRAGAGLHGDGGVVGVVREVEEAVLDGVGRVLRREGAGEKVEPLVGRVGRRVADDVLRDLFKRGKYPDVILPMCVIRRMDAVITTSDCFVDPYHVLR